MFSPRGNALRQHYSLGKLYAAYPHSWWDVIPHLQDLLLDIHHPLPRHRIVAVINAAAKKKKLVSNHSIPTSVARKRGDQHPPHGQRINARCRLYHIPQHMRINLLLNQRL